MDRIHELSRASGFANPQWIEGRESIADLFRMDERCGIYLLHFSNGEFYIGQAVNVVRRYNQHRKQHLDLQQISFCPCELGKLNEVERSAIQAFERNGIRLRNISLMSAPVVEADFDLLMPLAQQEAWLTQVKTTNFGGSRPLNPEQRRRYQRKFEQFQQLPHATNAVRVLRTYAQNCLPVVRSSELSFWCCSCLPGKPGRSTVYSRINVSWQEVFTLFAKRYLCFSWHVACSPFEKVYGRHLWRFQLRHPLVHFDRTQIYIPGGVDQIKLSTIGTWNALRLLKDPLFLQAARLFNLRLMRKGACTFSRYHCMDLADQLMPV